jgi:hypothetical protein
LSATSRLERGDQGVAWRTLRHVSLHKTQQQKITIRKMIEINHQIDSNPNVRAQIQQQLFV